MTNIFISFFSPFYRARSAFCMVHGKPASKGSIIHHLGLFPQKLQEYGCCWLIVFLENFTWLGWPVWFYPLKFHPHLAPCGNEKYLCC